MIFYLANTGVDLRVTLIIAAAIAAALVTGISFHEFSHAFVADSLGDKLPRARGRVTLNPLAHLDRTGTMLMVLIGFGWGKPVPINPNATKHPKEALWMTALAGPFSNFVVAAVFGLPIRLGWIPYISPFNTPLLDFLDFRGMATDEYFGLFFSSIVLFNVILGLFNLIPIAPLDGFKVVQGLLPRHLAREFSRLEQYGPLLLIALIALPFLSGGRFGLLFETMQPFIRALVHLFTGVNGDVFVERPFYRLGQLRRALSPAVTETERTAARNALGERLYPLFASMQPADQRHCLDVFESLLESGQTDAGLLAAALLHDCGKGEVTGARIGLWHRISYVMLAPAPPLLRAACRLSPGLAALRNHGSRTVALVREYGATPAVVELVEQAEGLRPVDDRGRALKRADDAA